MLTRRSATYAGVVWSAGALNLVLNLLLVPRIGAIAAALTTVASQAFVAVIAVVLRPKGVGLRFLAPAFLGLAVGAVSSRCSHTSASPSGVEMG